MCRFVLYSGPPITLDLLTTEPTHSIINQSHHARLRSEPLNGDGFGLAWYVPDISPTPARFRSIQPAWSNTNLRHVARVSRSEIILAHVRAASKGLEVTELNCHPFIDGNFAFMHNGQVANFLKLRRQMRSGLSDYAYKSVQGTTDSEILFAKFLDYFGQLDGLVNASSIASALESTIQFVFELTGGRSAESRSALNLAVTDGQSCVVSRCATDLREPPSLYMWTGAAYSCSQGVCKMQDGNQGAVIVASEPLTEDESWKEVPADHLVLISPDRSAVIRSIALN